MTISIIAEAGVNHNGDINIARELIDAAVEAGADMVKFQTFKADRLATQTAPKANYQIVQTGNVTSQFEMLKKLELSEEMHISLMKYSEEKKIEFISTAFDIESLQYLKKLGMRKFKLPSGEITNLPYLKEVGSFGNPLIISTGMASLEEVQAAIQILEAAGTERDLMTVLHCTTEYPAPLADVNLNAMQTMRKTLGINVGYSDHTMGLEVPIAAAALGATIIEKHLTMDQTLPGPDHKASMTPKKFKEMVTCVRNIERALGDGVKRVTESELRNVESVRKSIVAAKTISIGETFSAQNLTVKRPGTGLSPMVWEDVIGRRALKTFEKDEFIVI